MCNYKKLIKVRKLFTPTTFPKKLLFVISVFKVKRMLMFFVALLTFGDQMIDNSRELLFSDPDRATGHAYVRIIDPLNMDYENNIGLGGIENRGQGGFVTLDPAQEDLLFTGDLTSDQPQFEQAIFKLEGEFDESYSLITPEWGMEMMVLGEHSNDWIPVYSYLIDGAQRGQNAMERGESNFEVGVILEFGEADVNVSDHYRGAFDITVAEE